MLRDNAIVGMKVRSKVTDQIGYINRLCTRYNEEENYDRGEVVWNGHRYIDGSIPNNNDTEGCYISASELEPINLTVPKFPFRYFDYEERWADEPLGGECYTKR